MQIKDINLIFSDSLNKASISIKNSIDLNQSIEDSLEIIKDSCKKDIIICALGKSGYIGQKFNATLLSLGISSSFLHASEALHGDLGSLKNNCLVFFISHSGETQEVVNVAFIAKERGAKCISLSSNHESSLSKICDSTIKVPHEEIVCNLGVAPMSSTTTCLAICDAISNCLSVLRGVSEKDFRENHPGGQLGKILSPVGDFIINVEDVSVNSKSKILETLPTMSGKGYIVVKDEEFKMSYGIFTDGDLRRMIESKQDLSMLDIGDHCSKEPHIISETLLIADAERIMDDLSIKVILVKNKDNFVIGVYEK